MQPNVKFQIELPKKNLGLAKSHLQKHVATRKNNPYNSYKDKWIEMKVLHLIQLLSIVEIESSKKTTFNLNYWIK